MEVERTVTVSNKYGLHARASTVLVKTATQYESDVRLGREGGDDFVRFSLVENEHRIKQAVRGIRELF